MNYAMILAAGVGQRMRNGGMPKQFLKIHDKPIVIYTLEKFELNEDIDKIVVVCHGNYVEYMQKLIEHYQISKVIKVIVGGKDRQTSLIRGLDAIKQDDAKNDDIVIIHDGVRPLVSDRTIYENVRVAKETGCAITVRAVTESVVVTDKEEVKLEDFKKRAATYSMTSPQSFQFKIIEEAYLSQEGMEDEKLPLLDAAMVVANKGGKIHLVKEQSPNIKITTPEDYYMLKAILEFEESKHIFGL